MSEVFTPITELSAPVCDLERHIPDFARPEHIGINVTRLGQLAWRGGFYHDVRITGQPQESVQERPSVLDITPDGTGLAARRATACQPDLSANPVWDDPDNYYYRGRRHLTLEVDVTQLADGIQRRGEVRDPAAWANDLDAMLASGVRTAAWQHLVQDAPPPFEVRTAVAWSSFAGLMGVLSTTVTLAALDDAINRDNIEPINQLALPLGLMVGGTLLAALAYFRKIVSTIPNYYSGDHIASILPLWHVDRALWVSASSRIGKLATKI